MTIYLDEDCLGADRDIVFPNVQTCIALIVSGDGGGLVGMHIMKMTKAREVLSAGEFMRSLLKGDAISNIVCIGNVSEYIHREDLGMIFPGGLRKTIKSALQYTGLIRYYNTEKLYKKTTSGAGSGGLLYAPGEIT